MTPITYDVKTAAEVSGLSKSHLETLLRSGALPGKRSHRRDDGTVGGKWLIKPADLAAYIDSLPDG